MVYFQGQPSFGGLPHPPILARSIGRDGWSVPMDRIEWARHCAQVWDDCGPLDENDNWIPAGEDRQQFIQRVLSYLPNAGYGSGGGIPSAAESSAVDYQDDESDDESDDEDGFSEEEDDESDDESNDCFSVEEDDDEGPVQGLRFRRISGSN